MVERINHSEDNRQPPPIVAYARCLEHRAVPLDGDVGFGREDGVEVGAENKVGFRPVAWTLAEHIADTVHPDIAQSSLLKKLLVGFAALLLVEWRSGDFRKANLLFNDFGFVGSDELQCLLDFWVL